jgi:hypothetical protein
MDTKADGEKEKRGRESKDRKREIQIKSELYREKETKEINHTCKKERKERNEENIKLHINLRCCTRISVHVMKPSS